MKKIIIIGIVVVLLAGVISLFPYTQSLERTFYGVDSVSGEPVEISLDLKHVRYLLRRDEIQGKITATCGDLVISDKQLQYIGLWPAGSKGEEVYYFIGWHLNLDIIPYNDGSLVDGQMHTSAMESLRVYLSEDFSKIALCHWPNEHAKDTTPKQFVATIDNDMVQDAIQFFGNYIQ